MTFSQSIESCFTKYADFKGRASRSEFWWFALFSYLSSSVISGVNPGAGVIYALAIMCPSLAVDVRRYHDLGLAGGFPIAITVLSIPFLFVPSHLIESSAALVVYTLAMVVMYIIFLYQAAQPGQKGDNDYGSDPLENSFEAK